MNIRFEKHTGFLACKLFFNLLLIVLLLPNQTFGAQWQKLTQTSRFQISIDMESTGNGPQENASTWLNFVPLSPKQRREAAATYLKSGYYQHMEQYEINCSEQSANLKRVIILDKHGKQIESIENDNKYEVIIPGSALEIAARVVCPDEDPVEIEGLPVSDVTTNIENNDFQGQIYSDELKQKIANAKAKTAVEPANASTWIELGNIYFDADMPRESIDAYSKALKITPGNIELLNDQGAMYRKTGDFVNALKNYEKVLTIAPNNLESLYITGYIYAIELNRTNEAIPLWKRYLDIDSSSETASQIKQYIEKYGK